jgi:hypothetical protein
MKRIGFIFFVFLLFSSCAATWEAANVKDQSRQEAKLERQLLLRQAVESGHFIIKLDRIYLSYGGFIDLVPRSNYIIVDGGKAKINTAYIGRQYSYRPISAINMRGETIHYKLKGDQSKGRYDIDMRVVQGGDAFDVYLSISESGTCSVSLSHPRISSVRYAGRVFPVMDRIVNPAQTPQPAQPEEPVRNVI